MNKLLFSIFSCCLFLLAISQAYASPTIDLKAEEKYSLTLQKAITEKLSPKVQNNLGIRLNDIVCFDNKIPLLKLTTNDSVACVTFDTAKRLEQINWGIQKSSNYDNAPSPEYGLYCWNIRLAQPESSKTLVIKDFRLALLGISEKYAWRSIGIEEEKQDRLMISTVQLHEDEIPKMLYSLKSVKYISQIEFREYNCHY